MTDLISRKGLEAFATRQVSAGASELPDVARTALHYLDRLEAAERERDQAQHDYRMAKSERNRAQAEVARLTARLSAAEAYIPSRDYEDYRGDADAAALAASSGELTSSQAEEDALEEPQE